MVGGGFFIHAGFSAMKPHTKIRDAEHKVSYRFVMYMVAVILACINQIPNEELKTVFAKRFRDISEFTSFSEK